MESWFVEGPQRLTLEGDVQSIDVWLVHGKLHVVGTDGPPRVEVRKVGRKGLNVTQQNGVLSVRHDAEKGWALFGGLGFWNGRRSNYMADVIVAVAPEAAGGLTVVAGDIVVSGLRAGVSVDVTSGTIAVMGLGGEVRAKTVSGSIEAVGVSGSLSMETVSGEISIAGSSAERVRARTISGAVTCDLDNPYVRDLQLNTVSGSITIRVPEDADLDVSLGAASGGVSSAFPQIPANNTMGTHSASGRIGVGTGSLRAYAVSGSVALLASPAAGENTADDDAAAA